MTTKNKKNVDNLEKALNSSSKLVDSAEQLELLMELQLIMYLLKF